MSEQTAHNQALTTFNANVIDEFRANGGKVGGRFAGAELLLLTTHGAKSARLRVTPLQYLRVEGRIIVVGAYAGANVDPAWVHNLRADPSAHIEVGARSFEAIAHELLSNKRQRVWSQIVSAEPGFAEYQLQTSRVFPVFEIRPV